MPVHWTNSRAASLVRGHPPGSGGERGGRSETHISERGSDHLPVAVQALRQGRRDDWHGQDRGMGRLLMWRFVVHALYLRSCGTEVKGFTHQHCSITAESAVQTRSSSLILLGPAADAVLGRSCTDSAGMIAKVIGVFLPFDLPPFLLSPGERIQEAVWHASSGGAHQSAQHKARPRCHALLGECHGDLLVALLRVQILRAYHQSSFQCFY